MLFSALKLIGETIHELGMLFFSKDQNGETMSIARGGYVIFFIGALLSAVGIQSLPLLIIILGITVTVYFVYTIYKMSHFMSVTGLVGIIFFEILFWTLFCTVIVYILIKLYNGVIASLPFI